MFDQPSLSGKSFVTLSGHLAASGLYRPGGRDGGVGVRRLYIDQRDVRVAFRRREDGRRAPNLDRHPAGAMNVLPATVVRGVSAARTSLFAAGGCWERPRSTAASGKRGKGGGKELRAWSEQ